MTTGPDSAAPGSGDQPARGPRIALGQIAARCDDVPANLDTILEYVERAREQGAGHVIFPELALSGYLVDRRYEHAAIGLHSPETLRLREASRGIAITLGFIEETPKALFYNSSATFHDGHIVHRHRKIYPPTYGPFDERRYYGAGWDVSAYEVDGAHVAMLVCGDAWHLTLPYMAAHDGADVLFILAASTTEGLMETTSCEGAWLRLCQTYALTLSCFVVFVNQAAGEGTGDFHYWGGSFVAGPDGNLLVASRESGPDLVLADLDLGELRRQRMRLPFRRDDSLVHTIDLGRRVLAHKLEQDRFASESARSQPVPPGKPT